MGEVNQEKLSGRDKYQAGLEEMDGQLQDNCLNVMVKAYVLRMLLSKDLKYFINVVSLICLAFV